MNPLKVPAGLPKPPILIKWVCPLCSRKIDADLKREHLIIECKAKKQDRNDLLNEI